MQSLCGIPEGAGPAPACIWLGTIVAMASKWRLIERLHALVDVSEVLSIPVQLDSRVCKFTGSTLGALLLRFLTERTFVRLFQRRSRTE